MTTTATADTFRAERKADFAFGETEARAAALAWARGRWLAAFALSRQAHEGAIESAWVPAWLIGAHAVAHWEGSGLRGIVEMDFGSLPVGSDLAADRELMEALEPWPARSLRPHDGRVAGHPIANAPIARAEALAHARRRMERELMDTARRSQPPAARERMRLLGVEYPREACEPVLLPRWQLDGLRLGRRWRIAVNGVTGKVAGVRA